MELRLLIVEDDVALAKLMAVDLGGLGHHVSTVHDGMDALVRIADEDFDAVILDRMLPSLEGVPLLQRLRQQNVTVPIVMLTALGRAPEKIEGLEAGADDYVVKPVSSLELNARIHAILRGRQWTGKGDDTIRAGEIVVSPSKYRAWRDGTDLDLPATELKILAELARNAGSVVTRAMLLERVWNYDFEPRTNVVEVYIRRLRMKLTAHGGDDPIITMRGVGYMLKA